VICKIIYSKRTSRGSRQCGFILFFSVYTFIFHLTFSFAGKKLEGREQRQLLWRALRNRTVAPAEIWTQYLCSRDYSILVKVTLKLSLCFNWAPRHEGVLGEWRYSSTHCDFGTRLRWVVGFTPRLLYPMEGAPLTHWIGGWVGPRAVLDAMKRKIPSPRRESNPRTPIVQGKITDM
jgi:hypothetical protein